ncbi:hypothetical protein [uncultured Brevundimonas sp.]|uniref:hypothetical protein n=1 Tax=uncultured Brevundimonas sp. TaxID=213418 RepID=UPI0030EE9939|tara:strand:+ start:20652 stop:21095 length:444 start_codon:yes stop_codon:yes gene_type:complete
MKISTALARRPAIRYLAAVALCAAGGGVGGVLAGTFGSASPVGVLIAAAGGTFAMLIVAGSSVLWWNTLDEAAREAHKWAWWWGSTGGLAVGGVAVITLVGSAGSDAVVAALGSDPVDILLAGGLACALFQIIGYALAWAGWWLVRR